MVSCLSGRTPQSSRVTASAEDVPGLAEALQGLRITGTLDHFTRHSQDSDSASSTRQSRPGR